MRNEFGRAAAVIAVCFGIAVLARSIQTTAWGQRLPSISLKQTVETAGYRVQQGNLSDVTAVFSELFWDEEEDVVSVSAPSEVQKTDADE
jgi:hypothetical protein